MITNSVFGLIVLHNPQRSYLSNICSVHEQVSELMIFDNSLKTASWILDFTKMKEKIIYRNFKKNMGVAFALNYAADYSIHNGFTFLLTMDQDSYATPGMVKKMLGSVKNTDDVGIISPYHKNKISTHKVPGTEIEDKLVVMTSGNLLNLNAYQKVGPFREDFFIDYVDTEYCMRLKKNNFRVVRVNSVPIYHNEANVSKKKVFGKGVYPYNHAPRRLYFKVRNRFYLRDLYKKTFPDYFEYEYPLFRNMLIKILLFEKERIKKIKYAIKGFIDYKRGVNYSPFDI